MQPASGGPAATTTRIAICVPTFQRNNMLRDCLGAVNRLHVPERLRVEVIVADNDAAGGAQEVCEELRGAFCCPLHYVIEPQRGLASIRNRLLEEALRLNVNWIAFVDDDECPDTRWLERHMEALDRFQADVSSGPVIPIEAGRAPQDQGPSRRPTGSAPRHVACNNVVLKSALARDQQLRFDTRFNFIGGEDFEFFERSRGLGNKQVWVAEAIVTETIPPDRATWRYLFKRHFSGATNAVVRYRKTRGSALTWLHFMIKAVGKLLGAGISLLCAALSARRRPAQSAVKQFASALGYLCGLFSLTFERYR